MDATRCMISLHDSPCIVRTSSQVVQEHTNNGEVKI